jgi:HNH endonuclease
MRYLSLLSTVELRCWHVNGIFAYMACSVENCRKPVVCRGWCNAHYQKWQTYGDPTVVVRYRHHCSVEGCDRVVHGRGLCSLHWQRWQRHGDPLRIVRAPAGAGTLTGDGYRQIPVNGKRVYEHRHVWEQHHGPIPKDHDIHHRNGDRTDNRIENLECVPRQSHGKMHANNRWHHAK